VPGCVCDASHLHPLSTPVRSHHDCYLDLHQCYIMDPRLWCTTTSSYLYGYLEVRCRTKVPPAQGSGHKARIRYISGITQGTDHLLPLIGLKESSLHRTNTSGWGSGSPLTRAFAGSKPLPYRFANLSMHPLAPYPWRWWSAAAASVPEVASLVVRKPKS